MKCFCLVYRNFIINPISMKKSNIKLYILLKVYFVFVNWISRNILITKSLFHKVNRKFSPLHQFILSCNLTEAAAFKSQLITLQLIKLQNSYAKINLDACWRGFSLNRRLKSSQKLNGVWVSVWVFFERFYEPKFLILRIIKVFAISF